jgi:nucleoside transporter
MTNLSAPTPSTAAALKYRLYLMMFLQYFIQGSYLPVISAYLEDGLSFNSDQVGMFKAALSLGPLVAPFFIGQVVDRHFTTEKVLAVCHVCGGLIMIVLFMLKAFLPIILLGAAYSALYVPSMMLTNSLTFHHLVDREREFPRVRLWGTIGFIVPAWSIEPLYLSRFEGAAADMARGVVLLSAGVAGLVMAAYCLTLPHTPPSREKQDFAPGKVIELLRQRNFGVLVGISLIVALVHSYFWVWNAPYLRDLLQGLGVQQLAEQRISSIGQIAEVLVMAWLGFAVRRFGFKSTMLIGTAAYVLRYVILAYAITVTGGTAELIAGGWFLRANPTGWYVFGVVFLGQALHGFCFGCFLAAAYMYVDKVAPPDVKGSMQTFYGTFIVGAGMFLGGLCAGWIGTAYELDGGGHNWVGVWLWGAGIAAVAMVGFAVLFPGDLDSSPDPAPP